MRNNRKYKLFYITADCLLDFIRNSMSNKKFKIEGIPKTAEYVNVFWDPLRNCFGIILYHRSFPIVKEAELIPEIENVTITVMEL